MVIGTRKGKTTETVQLIVEILRADCYHEADICEFKLHC